MNSFSCFRVFAVAFGVSKPAERATSGLSTLKKEQIAERGAWLARRNDQEYREYLREEQRRQPRGPQRGTRVGVEEGCIGGQNGAVIS
jgi:hypothetical protein